MMNTVLGRMIVLFLTALVVAAGLPMAVAAYTELADESDPYPEFSVATFETNETVCEQMADGGIMTPEMNFRDEFRTIIQVVECYFDGQYANMPKPEHYYFIDWDQVIEGGPCFEDEAGTDRDFAYCGNEDAIYIGMRMVNQMINTSPIAVLVGMLHEYGHHVQFVTNKIEPTAQNERKMIENQADCMAGAGIGSLAAQGRIGATELSTLGRLMDFIGDPPPWEYSGSDLHHGTPEERRHMFDIGYHGSLFDCNNVGLGPIIAQ